MPTSIGTTFLHLSPAFIIAAEPQSTFLGWLVSAMSIATLIAFFLEVVIFIGACYVATRVRRIEVIVAYLLFVPIPALIAFSSGLRGIVSSFAVASMSEVEMPQIFVIRGLIEPIALFCTSVFFSVPSYIILTIAIFLRAISQTPGNREQ